MAKPVVFNGFRGINNVLPEDALFTKDGTYLRTALNVDIDNAFKIRRRKGYGSLLPGQTHSLWSDGSTCLFREGTALKRLFDDFATTATLRNDIGGNLPMAYVSLDGRVYYSDSVVTGVIEGGVSRSWGLIPPPAPVVESYVGSLRAGRYLVSLTYVRNDGQESGTDAPTVITLTETGGIQVYLTASGDPGVSSIRLYTSACDGDQLFLAGTFPNQSGWQVYSGETELGPELKTLFFDQAPAGHMLEYFNGRIYVADGQYVFPSKPYAYELFDLEDYLPFDGPISLLGAVEDGLFIADGRRTYFVKDPKVRVPVLPYGAITGTMTKIDLRLFGDGGMEGTGLMWISRKGIVLGTRGGSVRNLSESVYVFEAGSFGAGLFRQSNGHNQYVALLQGSVGESDAAYRWHKITSSNLELPFEATGELTN
jgi:hypothetical protein